MTESTQPYEVGYGKPPVHTRFPKGRSGNPSGRRRRDPLTARSEKLLLAEAYRLITAREGDKVSKVPAIQAVMRAQNALAAKGNGPAQRAVLKQVQAMERGEVELNAELLKTAIEYRHEALTIQQERKRKGIADDGDPMMPRPEDVAINMQTGEVVLLHADATGPQPVSGSRPPFKGAKKRRARGVNRSKPTYQ